MDNHSTAWEYQPGKYTTTYQWLNSLRNPCTKTQMFETWMNRCVGQWVSHRRYLYGKDRTVDNLITKFNTDFTDDGWVVEWGSDRNTGRMELTLDGDMLHRSRGYYNDTPTSSKLEKVDIDTVVFHSAYDGMKFREEIRFIHHDTARLRQTVGYKDDKLIICGQYFEERL